MLEKLQRKEVEVFWTMKSKCGILFAAKNFRDLGAMPQLVQIFSWIRTIELLFFLLHIKPLGFRHRRSTLRAPSVPATPGSALLVRLRRLGDSGGTQGKTEAEGDGPLRRVVPAAERRPTTRGLDEPAAAKAHAVPPPV